MIPRRERPLFVQELHTSRWREGRKKKPSMDEVRADIGRLDQEEFSAVFLRGPDEKYLAIGSGRGRYVVFDDLGLTLLGDGPPEDLVWVGMGGEDTQFPANQVVGLEQALKAGITYAESGELDQGWRWGGAEVAGGTG